DVCSSDLSLRAARRGRAAGGRLTEAGVAPAARPRRGDLTERPRHRRRRDPGGGSLLPGPLRRPTPQRARDRRGPGATRPHAGAGPGRWRDGATRSAQSRRPHALTGASLKGAGYPADPSADLPPKREEPLDAREPLTHAALEGQS